MLGYNWIWSIENEGEKMTFKTIKQLENKYDYYWKMCLVFVIMSLISIGAIIKILLFGW